MKLRPFEDLIKPIEYDGKTFVPIEEIAKLACNNNSFVKNIETFTERENRKRIANKYRAEIIIKDMSYESVTVTIEKSFRITLWIEGDWIPHFNQVQIVKNLIKWGFVEP